MDLDVEKVWICVRFRFSNHILASLAALPLAVLPESMEKIKNTFANKIDPNTVAIVTGFIGHTTDGKITTLGRGGSDLSATTIGAACGLDEIQVWKDVDGIMR